MIKFFSPKFAVLAILAILIFTTVFVGFVPTVSAKPEDDLSAHTTIHFKPLATASPTGLSPTQIKSAYNLPFTGGTGTIAIVDAYDCPTVKSDLTVFHNQYFNSLIPLNFEEYKMSSSIPVNAGWALEISLDVQWAHAIAPNAKILLVEAKSNSFSDLFAAVDYARGRPDVVAVSMSWGGGEFSIESSYDYHFTGNVGVTFFASSGDSGSGTIWPSTSPNVVAVGGTTLTFNPDGTWSSETGWSGSGGGISAYEAAPSYQQTFGTGYSKRTVPDVSYNADPNSGVPVYDTTTYNGQTGWWQVGGTSAGSPQWAAIHSLGLSAFNTNFYQDAKSASHASYLRDITSGSNGYSAGPGYDLVTGLGSPVTTNFTPVITPDFAISASPSALSIVAGSQATSTITTTSQGGFANQVTLAAPSTLTTSFDTNPINGAGKSTLTIKVPTTTPPGTYTITVTGTSGSLSHSTTVTVNVPAPPGAPVNLKATPGNAQVALSWVAPTSNGGSPVTGYNVYRSTSSGTEVLFKGLGNVLSYVDTSLKNGQVYYYQVTAVNAAGESVKSSEVSATPSASSSLKVTVGTDKSNYSRGSTVTITTTVTDGTNPVQGASVAVTIYSPRNTVVWTGSGVTDSHGKLILSYRLGNSSSSRGTYTVTATASKSGYQMGTGQTTFSVS